MTPHAQRSRPHNLRVVRLTLFITLAIILATATLFAQVRTVPTVPLGPPGPTLPTREIVSANAPSILSDAQLATLHTRNEQAQLLQMFPFDILWGLP